MLTNNRSSFMKTSTVCTGLSDFHQLVVTVLKSTLINDQPKEIIYRDYKKFDISCFNKSLTNMYAIENTT